MTFEVLKLLDGLCISIFYEDIHIFNIYFISNLVKFNEYYVLNNYN